MCAGQRNRTPLEGYEYEGQIADVADDILPGGNIRPNQGDSTTFVAPFFIPEETYLKISKNLT